MVKQADGCEGGQRADDCGEYDKSQIMFIDDTAIDGKHGALIPYKLVMIKATKIYRRPS
jgi:hypothetical protein